MKTLNVEVKSCHLEKGWMGEPDSCPIALSLSDAGGESVSVGSHDARFFHNGIDQIIDLPVEVCIFIKKFDSGENVEPFDFSLSVREI